MLKQREVHEDLNSSLPAEKVEEWKSISLEPVRALDGKWTSPMIDPLLSSTHLNPISFISLHLILFVQTEVFSRQSKPGVKGSPALHLRQASDPAQLVGFRKG